MRVIAGTLGGRVFDSPHSNRTHPMSDKIRGALFNTLGDIEGLTFLDAFSGSGALSFEAISRGAAQVLAIENDAAAQRAVQTNIQSLDATGHVTLVGASVSTWLDANPDMQFDVVLADPPYDNLQQEVVQRLAIAVKQDGLLVVSWPGDVALPEFPGFQQLMNRGYGDAQLAYYRR